MVYSSLDSVSRGKTDTKSAACARGLARSSDSALSAENRQANLWRSTLAWLGLLVAEAGARAKPTKTKKTCIKRRTFTGLWGWQRERGPMCWSRSHTSMPKTEEDRYNLLKLINRQRFGFFSQKFQKFQNQKFLLATKKQQLRLK